MNIKKKKGIYWLTSVRTGTSGTLKGIIFNIFPGVKVKAPGFLTTLTPLTLYQFSWPVWCVHCEDILHTLYFLRRYKHGYFQREIRWLIFVAFCRVYSLPCSEFSLGTYKVWFLNPFYISSKNMTTVKALSSKPLKVLTLKHRQFELL